MVRFAKPWEFDKLAAIWNDCFGDGEQYANFIFKRLQKPDNILIYVENDKPAAMLSFRELELVSLRTRCAAAYIYGVATAVKFRGRGYASKLIENAGDLFKSRRYACSALVPGDEGLARFYRKKGYETGFHVNKVTVIADEIPQGDALELTPLNAGRFGQVRGMHFGDSQLCARWGTEYLGYIIDETRFFGGDVFGFTIEGCAGLAVCYPVGDTLYVKELAMKNYSKDLNRVLRSLKNIFPQQTFLIYLREDVKTSYTNNLLPFGMTAWYDSNARTALTDAGAPPYLAHVLD